MSIDGKHNQLVMFKLLILFTVHLYICCTTEIPDNLYVKIYISKSI